MLHFPKRKSQYRVVNAFNRKVEYTDAHRNACLYYMATHFSSYFLETPRGHRDTVQPWELEELRQ